MADKKAKDAMKKKDKVKGEKLVKESIKTETTGKQITWDEIKEGITGFARIVRYKNHSIDKNEPDAKINFKPKDLEIISVEEG